MIPLSLYNLILSPLMWLDYLLDIDRFNHPFFGKAPPIELSNIICLLVYTRNCKRGRGDTDATV